MEARRMAPLPSRRSSLTPQWDQPDGSTDHITTAAEVYRTVWDDFYRWKEEATKRDLQDLCVASPLTLPTLRRRRAGDDPDEDNDDGWSEQSYPSSYSSAGADDTDLRDLDGDMAFLAFEDSPNAGSIIITTVYGHYPDYLLDDTLSDDESTFIVDGPYRTSVKSAIGPNSEGIDPSFHPHPPYYSCTPTSTNLPPRSSKGTRDFLDFSPFEDDPAFDNLRYLALFPSFTWQTDFIDPDVEVIQLESVRRLYHLHGLSFAQIDDLNFLTKLRKGNESGLLWDTSQRDLISWPGASLSELPELHISDLGTIVPDDDLVSLLKAGLKSFCPNLNCIDTNCNLHRDIVYPPIIPKPPTITSQSLRLLKGNPCGNYCYRYIDLMNDFQLEAINWSNESEIKFLEGILQVSPDILPCDLAVIMHTKCQDVFVYRTRFYPDNVINDALATEQYIPPMTRTYNDTPGTEDQGQAPFAPLSPCQHKGVCSRDSGCPCFIENHRCQRNCHCSLDYGKDAPVNLDPGQEKMSVVRTSATAGRTAESVIPSYAENVMPGKHIHKRSICTNVTSQRMYYPTIQIARGKWGLGAFTTERIRKDHPVGEYVGELIPTEEEGIETEQISPLSSYTGLNYKFDLNKAYLLDSMYVGNEMRYLNHDGPITSSEGSDKQKEVVVTANCRGKVIYVNSSHRIIFFANRRIEAGSELFIDYGINYWTSQDEWEEVKKKKVYWR